MRVVDLDDPLAWAKANAITPFSLFPYDETPATRSVCLACPEYVRGEPKLEVRVYDSIAEITKTVPLRGSSAPPVLWFLVPEHLLQET